MIKKLMITHKKRVYIDLIITLFLLISLFCILSKPKIAMEASIHAQNIFLQTIFPTVFPMLIVSNLLFKRKFLYQISHYISFILRPILQLSSVGSSVLLFSILGGYPVGAILVSQQKKNGNLTEAEANRLSTYCNFSSPLFVIGTIGTGLLSSTNLGYLIYSSHIAAGLLTGLILRIGFPLAKNELTHEMQPSKIENNTSTKNTDHFFEDFINTIRSSLGILLNIGGIVIIFFVFLKLLYSSDMFQWWASGVMDFLQSHQCNKISITAVFSGLIEVSSGVLEIASQDFSQLVKGYYICFFISFSGLCVIAQCMLIYKKENIDTKYFLLGKISHAVLSIVIFDILYRLI